ncbi:hypothetical protein IT6_06375 [Methylacidiphilum caldifontis]|uniref:hypothetical protein n=1 Tax=Methylacidiphilum caldifontis TaxID=2795386 RepID=UPI001A8ECBBC|nr:hypothetical protein [Methylacidiphilum caldifontis]QSR88024.1 hypothetical protein IT6_06375 [Methylacidiphilum caldifontis]
MANKVVVGCRIGGYPFYSVGIHFVFLHWACGFRKLGWEVGLLEELSLKDLPQSKTLGRDQTLQLCLKEWESVLCRFGFEDHSALFIDGSTTHLEKFLLFAKESRFLLNISGLIRNRSLLSLFKKKVYLDLDPGFTQIWAKGYGCDMNLEGHDLYFSVGLTLKEDNVKVPFTGIKWHPTFPPVCLEWWPKKEGGMEWSTITHWCGYPEVKWAGKTYGNKAAEFDKFIDLPLRYKGRSRFQIASDLQDDHEIRKRFLSKNWDMISSFSIAADFDKYRNFIGQSRGEFSVVKSGYRQSESGWFSDRTVCYLAMGKPAVIQDTGWSKIIPTGEGLFSFNSLDEAIEAINKIEQDYSFHSMKAHHLAETLFDCKKVAWNVVEQLEKYEKKN